MHEQAVSLLVEIFERLLLAVPRPQETENGFRFVERTLPQAITLKFARLISLLNTATLLNLSGRVQELGILFRAMDETEHDLMFLINGLSDFTERHKTFLEAFWEEESYDPNNRRPSVPRQKIQASNARLIEVAGGNRSVALDNSKVLYNTYSGFVHGAAPHIMDLCVGQQPQFYLTGLPSDLRSESFSQTLNDHYYRGLATAKIITILFGYDSLSGKLDAYIKLFVEEMGVEGTNL